MPSKAIWTDLGPALIEALGLQAETILALDIRVACGEPVIVKTEQFVEVENSGALQRAFRRYELVEDTEAMETVPCDSEDADSFYPELAQNGNG